MLAPAPVAFGGELLVRAIVSALQYGSLFGVGTLFALGLFYGLDRWRIARDTLTRLVGSLLIVGSAALLLEYVFGRFSRLLLPSSNMLGQLAVLLAYGAAGQWVFRRAFRIAGLRAASSGLIGLLRKVLHYLRAHHAFFGWIVFVLASVHGLYFLLHPLVRRGHRGMPVSVWMDTGIAAWCVLFVLLGLGLLIAQRTKSQTHARTWRTVHRAVAVLFVVAVLIHI